MGFFGKGTSKQTAKLKSLIKLAAARLAVIRRPRLGRRAIARADVGQLLAIGHLDRALLRAEQVIDEDGALEALDIVELYCKILVEQATQLENPKECSEEVKAAAAGLMFASARCGELPELLDARAILADKFGRDFARAAREGTHGVVDPTLVRKLSGERASTEQTRRLAKEVAAENDVLLDFPEAPTPAHQGKQNGQDKNAPLPAEEFVELSEAKTERDEVQGKQSFVDDNAKRHPSLAQLSVEEKVLRESKKYVDARMAAEAAFKSASFAAMAARAAVELSRSESLGKGSTRGGVSRGYDKVHPVQNPGAAERETRHEHDTRRKASLKSPSPSPSPSSSERSTVSSAGSEAAQKGKGIVFDQSDGEDDEVVEDLVWATPLRRPPYRRTASTVGTGGGGGITWQREAGWGGADPQPFHRDTPNNNPQNWRPPHRRHASDLAGGNAPHDHEALHQQRGQRMVPPYRRSPTASKAGSNGGAARREEEEEEANGNGGAYESSGYVQAPYARMVSALERGHGHIARHEEVRRMGTDARVLQERVYGSFGGPVPMSPDRRAISVRTRR